MYMEILRGIAGIEIFPVLSLCCSSSSSPSCSCGGRPTAMARSSASAAARLRESLPLDGALLR